MKGFVLAGTESGVGKTVATLATIQALEESGLTVQPAKAGPDYIDPSHHATVASRPSRTLDSWLEGQDGLLRNYHRGSGDICIVEGVMGLYDGDHSSTAEVAALLDLPVVLVVDGSASMESVGATAYGFAQYASKAGYDIEVAGIISQRTHGGRHENGICEALPEELAYFGRIPPSDKLDIPERHLGLQMGDEAPLESETLSALSKHIDTERLREVAATPPDPEPVDPEPVDPPSEGSCRIGVAEDEAFRFIYPAVRERLATRGDVVTFAPTAGEDVPPCDGLYLPGGYPELHAEKLAGSVALGTMRTRASEGLPILGECGGLMLLADSLRTTDGDTFEMAGVLPAEIEMRERYQALDHVEFRAREDTLTASAGATRRGHEFHYSSASTDRDARFAFEMRRGDGIDGEHDGLTEYNTLGTYTHLHAESGAIDSFVDRIESHQ